MTTTGYRQVPNPDHHVTIREVRAGRARYWAECSTCGWSCGPVDDFAGPAHTAARRHIEGVRCCER